MRVNESHQTDDISTLIPSCRLKAQLNDSDKQESAGVTASFLEITRGTSLTNSRPIVSRYNVLRCVSRDSLSRLLLLVAHRLCHLNVLGRYYIISSADDDQNDCIRHSIVDLLRTVSGLDLRRT